MRWRGRRQSDNVEDRRGMSGPAVVGGGGLLLVAIVVIAMCMGADPRTLMDIVEQAPVGNPPAQAPNPQEQDEMSQFVSVVLGDTEDVWQQLFAKRGEQYSKPALVLFTGQIASACGYQNAAVGPFYCPLDQKVYIDLQFYEEMKTKLGAPGDFAQAYVIAHEVGHHVQNLLGIAEQVHQIQQRATKEEANQLSVRMELQADFFAGVWAHHAQQNWRILEEGDIEEGLRAATAIGDDRLQMESRGFIVPESFTHGSSEQRVRWFVRGLKSGDMDQGDTFNISFSQL